MKPSEALIFPAIDRRPRDHLYTDDYLRSVKAIWEAIFRACGNARSVAHTIEILIHLANTGPTTINAAAVEFNESVQCLHPKFVRSLGTGLVDRYQKPGSREWFYRLAPDVICEEIFNALVWPI
jgi:hypothetical protein